MAGTGTTKLSVVPPNTRVTGRPSGITVGYDPDADFGRHWMPDSAAGKVIQAVRVGLTYHRACLWADLPMTTFCRWRNEGEAQDRHVTEGTAMPETKKVYWYFWKETERAAVAGDMELLLHWRNAARDDWRAAAKLLAVRHPEEFSEQHQLKVSGDKTNPVVVEHQASLDALLGNPALALKARELSIAMTSGGVAPVLDVEVIDVEDYEDEADG